MWVRTGASYTPLQTQQFLHQLYPTEVHNVGGDCLNPKCDYEFTEADLQEMGLMSGWFTCPQCDTTYNYLNTEVNTKTNRAGLTNSQMGSIGESIVNNMGTIPLLGKISWFDLSGGTNPIDGIAGEFGIEVKTNHSEAQPRFKMGGSNRGGGRQGDAKSKIIYCQERGLRPALVGVRLNFYNDLADIFVRPDSLSDTWIGAAALSHVATENFAALNPFKNPQDVPPPSEMPDDDGDDIPF